MIYCYWRLWVATKLLKALTTKESDMSNLGVLAFSIWIAGSWLTHIVYCIQEEVSGFLIAGAIFFPIAVVHGTGVWFGIW